MDDFGLQTPPIPPTPTPPSPLGAIASATAGTPPPPVQPETPVITQPKKKFPFKPVVGTLVALLLVGGTVFLSRQLVQQRQTAEQEAAGIKCKDIDNPKDCNLACSVPKPNGKQFACKWHYPSNDCNESGQECEGGLEKPCSSLIIPCGANTIECGGTLGHDQFCIDAGGQYGCYDIGIACRDWAIGSCPQGQVNCYYCPNQFEFKDGCPGSGYPTAPLPAGVDYDKDSCKIKGSWCGLVQCDQDKNNFVSKIDRECASPKPSHLPSPTPSPSPISTLSCIDLTKNKPAPKLNDVVTFTCEANFSGVKNQRAYFRYSIDNGVTFTTPEPADGVPIDAATKKASHNITISQEGNWETQCRVCARPNNNDPLICTTWGRANVP